MKNEQNLALTWALTYARMGYYPIPIIPGSKAPVIKHKDHPRLTEEQITELWGRHPEYGIALKTVNHLVVDIDIGHRGGADGRKSTEEMRAADWWPVTLEESTPRGGRHFFFTKPDGFTGGQNIAALPGVDVKAGLNDLSMVFPTIGYKWLNWDAFSKVRPATAPQQLLDALMKPKAKPATPVTGGHWTRPSGGTNTLNAINAIIHGLGDEGGRNDFAARMTGTLLAIGVDPADVWVFLQQANRMTPEPLPSDEIERTFVSILSLHTNQK